MALRFEVALRLGDQGAEVELDDRAGDPSGDPWHASLAAAYWRDYH